MLKEGFHFPFRMLSAQVISVRSGQVPDFIIIIISRQNQKVHENTQSTGEDYALDRLFRPQLKWHDKVEATDWSNNFCSMLLFNYSICKNFSNSVLATKGPRLCLNMNYE